MNPDKNIKEMVWTSGLIFLVIHWLALTIYLIWDGFITIPINLYIKIWAIASASIWGIIITIIALNLLEKAGQEKS